MNSLNTVLINSHYPHLTNTLFNNLILPPGLIKKEPPNIKYKQIKIHYTDECIDPTVFNNLIKLIEIKSNKESQYDTEIKSRNTRKSANVKKEKEIKSRNTRKSANVKKEKEIKSRNTRKSANVKKEKEIKSRNTRKSTKTKNKYKKKTKHHKKKVNY